MPLVLADPITDDEFQHKVNEINAKYETAYADIRNDEADIKEDAENCIAEFAFDVEWGVTSVKFDVPEVKWKLREMKFHFVKTTFTNKVIAKFDVPEFRWEITRIGPIKTKVPKWYRKRVEISTKIPEFTWDITSVKTKIPEFFSKRVELKFHILKIKGLKEANLPCKSAEEKSEKLAGKAEVVTKAHKEEINTLVSAYLLDKAEEMEREIDRANSEFDQAASSLDEAIAECRKNNVDPGTIKMDFDGQTLSLTDARQALQARREEALEELVAAHAQILDAIRQL